MSSTLHLLLDADERLERLNDADELHAAAKIVVDACAEHPDVQLAAASPAAERVVGAAMVLNPTITGRPRRLVILVDVTLASGTQFARAARRLRHAGAERILGIALHAVASPPSASDCGLDDLRIACHEEPTSQHEPEDGEPSGLSGISVRTAEAR